MKTKRLIPWLLMLTLSGTLLTSCSAKAEMDSMNGAYDMSAPSIESAVMDSVTSATTSGSAGYVNMLDKSESVTAENAEFAAKIIKTVKMNTETKEYDHAIAELESLISQNGGFVESASSNGQSLYLSGIYCRHASYTIRIPADRLDSFLSASQQLLNVTNSHTESQNVTTEYYDLESRLAVLRTERDALNEMLEKADTVENMLHIRDRLYNVIEEIESYETQLRLYDSLVSYSTVHLTIEEVVEYTKIVAEEPSWGTRLVEAFRESWEDFADGFQDFTVGFLYAIPTLMVIALIAVAVILILRVLIRRAMARRAELRAAWQAKHPQAEQGKESDSEKD